MVQHYPQFENIYLLIYFYVYGYFIGICRLHICLCTTCVPDAHRGQKMASDSLRLELQTAVSLHVGAGNQM